MEPISRRKFFRQAGAVAAVAGAVSVAPIGAASALGASVPSQKPTRTEPELAASENLGEGEALVAHVLDPRTGEISLFIGEREVLIHDRAVAARLVRATR